MLWKVYHLMEFISVFRSDSSQVFKPPKKCTNWFHCLKNMRCDISPNEEGKKSSEWVQSNASHDCRLWKLKKKVTYDEKNIPAPHPVKVKLSRNPIDTFTPDLFVNRVLMTPDYRCELRFCEQMRTDALVSNTNEPSTCLSNTPPSALTEDEEVQMKSYFNLGHTCKRSTRTIRAKPLDQLTNTSLWSQK